MNGYQLVLRHPAASKIFLRCFSLSAAAGSYIRNSVSVRSGSCHRQRVRSCLSCFSESASHSPSLFLFLSRAWHGEHVFCVYVCFPAGTKTSFSLRLTLIPSFPSLCQNLLSCCQCLIFFVWCLLDECFTLCSVFAVWEHDADSRLSL